jgi:hypothetical protein
MRCDPTPPPRPPRPNLCKICTCHVQAENYCYSAIFIELKIIPRNEFLATVTGKHFDLLIKDLSITFPVENDTLLKIIVKITYGRSLHQKKILKT